MKFIKYSWCLIAGFFLLLSCTKEIGITPEPEIRYVTLSLDVSMDASIDSTKTYMDGTNGHVKWRSSDQVVIYFLGRTFGPITSNPASNIRNDGQTATFTYEIPDYFASDAKNSTKYVYYGKGNLTCNTDKVPISISIPSVQNYAGSDCFADGENISFGYMASGDTTCTMKNLFGILKVNIKLQSSSEIIDYVQLVDVSSGTSNYLAGEFALSNLTTVPTITHQSGTGGESKSLIKKVIGNWTPADSTFYFLVPPGTVKDFRLYVYTKGGYYAGRAVGMSKSIRRNVITNVPVSTFVPKSIPYDVEAPANSYIVPAAMGAYSIPAQFKGNSSTEISKSSVDRAEIIWQGRCNGDALIDGELISDAIYFTRTVNGKEYGFIGFHRSGVSGNALVALKNSSNQVIWSWHLWITEDVTTTKTGVVLKKKDGSNGITIMDRNLGALYADPTITGKETQTHGLAYQFGRKDPYMGSRFTLTTQESSQNYGSFASIFPALSIGCDEVSFSFSQSVLMPNRRSMPKNYDAWCSSGETPTWGNDSDDITISSSKSLYDPCPAGWRVLEEKGLYEAFGTASDGSLSSPSGEVVKSGDGLAFKLTNGSSYIYFPAAGISETTSAVTNVGAQVKLWCSNYAIVSGAHNKLTGNVLSFSLASLTTTGFTFNKLTNEKTKVTMPVRCQKEPSAQSAPSLVSSAESEDDQFEVVYID